MSFLMAFALLIAILLVTVIALNPLPRLIWNASKSVPIGFYWIEKRSPHVGEIAVAKKDLISALHRGFQQIFR